MRIDVTNESVEMNGKTLQDCVWVDPDNNEACIFCHDKNGRKIPTDTDPTGYETLLVKGAFKVTKTYPVKEETQPSFNWDPCCDPYGYPNVCCHQDVDRDGRNCSSIPLVVNGRGSLFISPDFLSCMIYNPNTWLWDRVRKHQMEPRHTMYWCDEQQVWVPRDA